jgi:hypothetical protein
MSDDPVSCAADVPAEAPDFAETGDEASGPWVYEALWMRGAAAPEVPNRILIGIEAGLSGFVVRQRQFWSETGKVHNLQHRAPSEAEAVNEAGGLAHQLLCRGYAVCLISSGADWSQNLQLLRTR